MFDGGGLFIRVMIICIMMFMWGGWLGGGVGWGRNSIVVVVESRKCIVVVKCVVVNTFD